MKTYALSVSNLYDPDSFHMSNMSKNITFRSQWTLVLAIFLSITLPVRAQYIDSMKGLLLMPSGEMEKDGTFMITNNFLNKSYVENPVHNDLYWGYNTFGYGFNITFWSRLEVGYICTIYNGAWNPYAESYRAVMIRNQDRHFAARGLLFRENEFGQNWIPSVVLGVSDPVTGSGGDYLHGNVNETGNGHFNRAYIAASKHFDTNWGVIGAHAAYQLTVRKYIIPRGPCAGVTWDPKWLNNPDGFFSSTRLIAEYDAKSVNVGLVTAVWKNHFELWGSLQGCQHFNGGLRFKVVLAGAEKAEGYDPEPKWFNWNWSWKKKTVNTQ